MRLHGSEESVRAGWSGIYEDAEPTDAYRKVGFTLVPIGLMDSSANMVRTANSRFAVRGGSQTAVAMLDESGSALTQMLTMQRYSQDGALVVGYRDATQRHTLALYSADLATELARHDITAWPAGPAAVPHAAELFEKMYLADATRQIGARQQLVSVDATGTMVAVAADLGNGSEVLKPYTVAVYNNTLFISGQDVGGLSAPAMVRHSFLGVSPDAAGNFDSNAYETVGAAGEYITAMIPGRNVLLVAKENELYRISGFGRALAGWQFVTTPIENTDYVGAIAPKGICFAEGYWYGVSGVGPWRTDGINIEVLVRSRLRSWRQVTHLERAVVRYDPTRRLILFGLVTGSATAINTIWLYDMDAEQFISDWTLPAPANDVYALAQQGVIGPAAKPGVPTFQDDLATLTTVAGSVTLGDTSAPTEIWVDRNTGVFVLDQTLPLGVSTFTIQGLVNSTQYPVKARAVKNGQYTTFSAVGKAYTKLAPPILQAVQTASDTVTLTVEQQAGADSDLSVTRSEGGLTLATFTTLPAGSIETVTDTQVSVGNLYHYFATTTNAAWPAAIQTAFVEVALGVTTTGVNMLPPSAPAFVDAQATTGSVHITFTPSDNSLQTEVAYSVDGGAAATVTLAAGVAAADVADAAMKGTNRVSVRLRQTDGTNFSAYTEWVVGHTVIALPRISVPSSGADWNVIAMDADIEVEFILKRGTTLLVQTPGTTHSSYYDSGLTAGKPYSYNLTAYRADWPADMNYSGVVTTNTLQPT